MDTLSKQWAQRPDLTKYATLLALPAAGYLAARILDDYNGWFDLGPGGLPYNIKGYLLNLFVTARYARATDTVDVYERPEKHVTSWNEASEQEKANANTSFLSEALPQRAEPRARALHYSIPQRERNFGEYVDPAVKKVSLGWTVQVEWPLMSQGLL